MTQSKKTHGKKSIDQTRTGSWQPASSSWQRALFRAEKRWI